MTRRLLILAFIALLTAGGTAWWYAPARVVERRTETLLTHLSIHPNGGVAARQAVVYALDGLLAPQVTFSSPDVPEANGDFSAQEISNTFALLAEHSQGTRFERETIHSVRVDGELAQVDLTLRAEIRMPGQDLLNGRFRVQLGWIHDGDRWTLQSASGKKIDPPKSSETSRVSGPIPGGDVALLTP